MRYLPDIFLGALGLLWFNQLISDGVAAALVVALACLDTITGGSLFRPDRQAEPPKVIALQFGAMLLFAGVFCDLIPMAVFFPIFFACIVLAGLLSPNGFSR